MLLGRLAGGPQRIAAAAVAAHMRRRAGGPGRPDAWSVREVVAHLVRVEREVFQVRLAQVAREDVPRWEWVEPGAEPGHASLATLIDRFARGRARTLDHLLTLHEEGWARTGIHATYGRLDVAALLGIAVEHDTDHLAELERRVG